MMRFLKRRTEHLIKGFEPKGFRDEVCDGLLNRYWIYTCKSRGIALFIHFEFDQWDSAEANPKDLINAYPDRVQEMLDLAYKKGYNSLIYLYKARGLTPDCAIIRNIYAERIDDAKAIVEGMAPIIDYKYVYVDANHPEKRQKIKKR